LKLTKQLDNKKQTLFKVGDIFYFVSFDSTNVRKKAIRTIEKKKMCDGNALGFGEESDKSNFVHIVYSDSEIIINPNLKALTDAGLKIEEASNRGYLIFSSIEKAVEALIDYIIPPMLEKQILILDKKQEEYFHELSKFQSLEKIVKELKGED
jgi:hypothetical protein